MLVQLKIGQLGLIEAEEGFVDHLYYDAVGVATEGFGTTLGAGVVNPLPPVCTRAEASGWLLTYVNRDVMPAIAATGFTPNPNQAVALACFGYNEGAGVFGSSHTMGQALISGSDARISEAFLIYVYAGGRILPDLVHRRQAEQHRFNTPVKPHVAMMHYDWFEPWERQTVQRYDALRTLSTHRRLTRQEQTWLRMRRVQCQRLAVDVRRQAFKHEVRDPKNRRMHPSWSLYRRGWRFQELELRAQGHLVRPV